MSLQGIRARLRTKALPQEQREGVTFLVLLLLAMLPYANTLMGGFVYDDNFQVIENPYAHSFRYLPQIFGTTVWSFQGAQGVTNYYRPLMTFGYLLTYQIAGLVPFSFHLFNIVLHAIVVWLIFFLVRRWSGERIAMVAAGLFALHPIHTESVAWIAGVTDLELAAFYLLTFLLYVRLADPGRGVGARVAMCASFALALLSKEQAMILPALATLFEHFYREDRLQTSLRQKLSRYAPLWAMAGLYLVVRTVLLGGVAGVISRPDLSWYEAGLSAVALVGAYLWKLLWPLHFSAFYIFHKSSHLGDKEVLLGMFGCALCAIAFVPMWRRARIVSFGLVWMFFTLGPVLNARWMPASVFAERYLYLPSVGFCWIFAWAAVRLWSAGAPLPLRPLSRAVPVVLTVVAMLYAVRTVTRNRVWLSEETLFRQALSTQENGSLLRTDLGTILFNHGDKAGAEHEWLEALNAGPNNVFVLGNLGLLRAGQHRYVEAFDYYGRALRVRPVYTMAHLNLAEALAGMDRTVEAEWQFRIATALSPLSTRAHNSYGEFLFNAERMVDARAEFERSAKVDPTTDAYDYLGDIYSAWKDWPRAELAFHHALDLDAFDSHAHFGLGKVYETTGRPGDALHQIESGLETDPSDADAKAALIRLRGNTQPSAQAISPVKNP